MLRLSLISLLLASSLAAASPAPPPWQTQEPLAASAVDDPFPRPIAMVAAGRLLYFTLENHEGIQELWRSDGTPEGTFLLKEIRTAEGAYFTATVPWDDTLFFLGADAKSGIELWKSDGTPEGTVLIKDILPGPTSSSPVLRGIVPGGLLFTADDGEHGTQLWKSDGTEAGTTRITNLPPGPSFADWRALGLVNGTLFYQLFLPPQMTLWKSDGTPGGTVQLRGGSGLSWYPVSEAFIAEYRGSADGPQLWRTDASGTEPVLLGALMPGHTEFFVEYSQAVDGRLFMHLREDFGYTGGHLSESALATSDGTAAGTRVVSPADAVLSDSPSISSSKGAVVRVGNAYFFAHWPDEQLRRIDGTSLEVSPVSSRLKVPNFFTLSPVGGALCFAADDGLRGLELWRTTGTEASTVLVKDLLPGPASSSPVLEATVGGTLYLLAANASQGRTLWKSDCTSSGTQPIKDFNPPEPTPEPIPGKQSPGHACSAGAGLGATGLGWLLLLIPGVLTRRRRE